MAAWFLVKAAQVEQLRREVAAHTTPTHVIASATAGVGLTPGKKQGRRRVSEAITGFMKDLTGVRSEQRGLVQQDLDLFRELTRDPRVSELDRELLKRYRDEQLRARTKAA